MSEKSIVLDGRGPRDCYRTFSGVFYPFDPAPEEILIEDIAWNLARLARFVGATAGEPYSVAQHSWLVSTLVPAPLALGGLLHDAEEAYFCDLPRPIKHRPELAGYRAAARRCAERIFAKYCPGIAVEDPAIKEADNRALDIERGALVPSYQRETRTGGIRSSPSSGERPTRSSFDGFAT